MHYTTKIGKASIMPADQPAALDPLLAKARELLLAHQNPSAGLLQRHLKIGFNRASGLMESLEGDIVSAPNADGWRRMLPSGNMSPSDPQSPD
jgi:DNA segregation ATPase FtsK/SpoIIIE-like protein